MVGVWRVGTTAANRSHHERARERRMMLARVGRRFLCMGRKSWSMRKRQRSKDKDARAWSC